MLKDIENRDDIYLLVKMFYKELLTDDNLQHFFEDFNDPVHLERHLQVLVDFWDNILFYSGSYTKNAMEPHIQLHAIKPFDKLHFQQWLFHFKKTVDTYFAGENAHTAKSRAISIATVMQIKISEINKQ